MQIIDSYIIVYFQDFYIIDLFCYFVLKVNIKKFFNVELFLQFLLDNFIIFNEIFFIRNYFLVLDIDEIKYELEIIGEGIKFVCIKFYFFCQVFYFYQNCFLVL